MEINPNLLVDLSFPKTVDGEIISLEHYKLTINAAILIIKLIFDEKKEDQSPNFHSLVSIKIYNIPEKIFTTPRLFIPPKLTNHFINIQFRQATRVKKTDSNLYKKITGEAFSISDATIPASLLILRNLDFYINNQTIETVIIDTENIKERFSAGIKKIFINYFKHTNYYPDISENSKTVITSIILSDYFKKRQDTKTVECLKTKNFLQYLENVELIDLIYFFKQKNKLIGEFVLIKPFLIKAIKEYLGYI